MKKKKRCQSECHSCHLLAKQNDNAVVRLQMYLHTNVVLGLHICYACVADNLHTNKKSVIKADSKQSSLSVPEIR